MHFDWYQATVPFDASVIIGGLLDDMGDVAAAVEHGRGRSNYERSTKVLLEDGSRALEVLHGGKNGHPNVVASGAAAAPLADSLRSRFPGHRVTRFDAAEDFEGEGVFDHLEGLCRAVGRRSRIKGQAIVPDDPADGQTYYLGAPSSPVRVRLYDKAAEMRSRKLPGVVLDVPEFVTRLEVQVRPKKDWRELAAKVPPKEAWGFAAWTYNLSEKVFGTDIPRVNMNAGFSPDHERSLRFMAQQYGRHLEELAGRVGSWEAAGARLEELVAEIRAEGKQDA